MLVSSNSKSLRFGLGADDAVSSVEVIWPSGLHEQFLDIGSTDMVVMLLEGTGDAIMPEAGPGDYNRDGVVNGADFLAWQRGESPIPLGAADLSEWKSNFGMTSASLLAPNIAVPEPTTAFLLMLAIAKGFLQRRLVS